MMIVKAYVNSNGLFGVISPYPTVVQVTVAQYTAEKYLTSIELSVIPYEFTQFSLL
jgi:hypothetical protein